MGRRRRVILLFIVVGGLVAVASIVATARFAPAVFQKGYQGGSDPEAVAYNFLLALVRRDYARAHGYLSPALAQYPTTVGGFLGDLEQHGLLPSDPGTLCMCLGRCLTVAGAGSAYRRSLCRGVFALMGDLFSTVALLIRRAGRDINNNQSP